MVDNYPVTQKKKKKKNIMTHGPVIDINIFPQDITWLAAPQQLKKHPEGSQAGHKCNQSRGSIRDGGHAHSLLGLAKGNPSELILCCPAPTNNVEALDLM